MASKRPDDTDRHLSWSDVREAYHEYGKAHNCHLELSIHFVRKVTGEVPAYIEVGCVARSWLANEKALKCVGFKRLGGATGAASLAGACLSAILVATQRLDALRAEKASGKDATRLEGF
jgi:hypothetical protein